MSPGVQAAAGSTTPSSAGPASSATNTSSSDVTKEEFLQLLVAQIQNQDPLNPTDGTQFLTQLAQFQQLEQSLNTGQDVSSILTDLNSMVTADGGAPATQS